MIEDKWGCHADVEYDEMIEARRLKHEDGECEGVPFCLFCLDELDEINQQEEECQINSTTKP